MSHGKSVIIRYNAQVIGKEQQEYTEVLVEINSEKNTNFLRILSVILTKNLAV